MIVTGCQRSGTKTVAEIFGIGHEVRFKVDLSTLKDAQRIMSEASWMAAPHLKVLKNQKIIHLVRHPVRVVNSMVGMCFFKLDHPEHEVFRDFVYTHCPGIDQNAKDVTQATQYWMEWNKLVEPYATARIRIEDFHTKIHLNSRIRSNILTYADLPGGSIKDQLIVQATEYGYTQ